jgi:hypothetical protein
VLAATARELKRIMIVRHGASVKQPWQKFISIGSFAITEVAGYRVS